jgi:septal ring factor EnvC (AmiA/AmiB activator)
MTYAALAVIAVLILTIYLWRKPDMDTKTLNDKIAKLTNDAKGVAGLLAAKDAQISDLTAKNVDLTAQVAGFQAAEDTAFQQISDGLDQLDAALPDAPAVG